MTSRRRLEWARAFIAQPRLDCELADLLYGIISGENRTELGSHPELYCPAMYAYCQQAIEKALKAWLWYATGSVPRKHNPLSRVLESNQMKQRKRPEHLELIWRSRGYLDDILNMAPGANLNNPSIETLLEQPNTEYPFASANGPIHLPCQEIDGRDVATALKITKPLVRSVRKFLEIASRGPLQV